MKIPINNLIFFFCFALTIEINTAVTKIQDTDIKWDDFLISIYDFLKDIKIQNEFEKYNVEDLTDWGHAIPQRKEGFPPITDNNFKVFFKILNNSEPWKFEKYKCFLGPKANVSSRYEQINEIVEETLHASVQKECVEDRLIIKGNIIRSSALIPLLEQQCFIQKEEGKKKPKIIEVFASYAVILDENIDLSNTYAMLSIITTNWFVVRNNIVIILDGKDAEQLPDATVQPANEVPGIPGLPGATAGNFWGLITGESSGDFKVSLVGGRGSDGTPGGNGSEGAKGNDGDEHKHDRKKFKQRKLFCRNRYYGFVGEPGRNAAPGGAGGLGGYKGTAELIFIPGLTKMHTNMKVISYTTNGTHGKGGTGGKGGPRGKTFVPPLTIFGKVKWEDSNWERGPSGKNGIDGGNDRFRKKPLPAIDSANYLAVIIPDYFKFLLDSLLKRPLQSHVFNEVKLAINETKFSALCNITCFVDMYVALEERFHFLHNIVNTTVLYNLFLDQLNRRTKELDEKKIDEKKVLQHLFTSVQAKLHSSKEHIEERFIANLNDFLNMFIEKLKKYKELKREVSMAEANKAYKKDIDDQIEDANNMIESKLRPEIEKLDHTFDETISLIQGEIREMKTQTQDKYALLAEARVNEKNAFVFKMFAAVMKGIGLVAGCIGTVLGGPVVGGAISGTANILAAGAEMATPEVKIPNLSGASQSLAQTSAYFEQTAKNRVKIVRDAMKEYSMTVEQEIKSNPGFKKSLQEIKNFLEKEKKYLTDKMYPLIEPLVKKSREIFGKANNLLEKSGISKFLNSETFGKITVIGDTITKGINLGMNTASQIMEHKEKLKEIDDKQAQCEEDLKQLRNIEKNIDDQMKPMLHSMSDRLANMPAELQGKNSVDLDSKKIEVEGYLNGIIAQVSQFTQSFKSGQQILTAIDSMKSVINKIFNVFQKITQLEDKKKLADHMAKLNAPAMSATNIVDPTLKDSVTKLLATIDANVILTDYKIWLKQMKLFVFPLADTYMQSFRTPDVLKPKDTTLDGYIYTAVNEVERFRMQYIESHVYVMGYDTIKHRGLFYKHTINKPFFVWKNSEYEDYIARLLGGQKAFFESLAVNSKLNAIKFRRIDLYIRAKNASRQPELDELLRNYIVKMKHTGGNYYNCNNKTYLATIAPQEFQFSYQYINNEPVDKNLVYDKILHGDYMLSPFTTWKIQLVKKNISNYHALAKFRREVDVELVGEGEYFEDNPSICQEDLSNFFEMADQRLPKQKKPEKPFTCPPPEPPPPGGYLFCEMNHDYDLHWWCRAIVRKFDGPLKSKNIKRYSGEDDKYYYYDDYFKKEEVKDEISAKFAEVCIPGGKRRYNAHCMAQFDSRPRDLPWKALLKN